MNCFTTLYNSCNYNMWDWIADNPFYAIVIIVSVLWIAGMIRLLVENDRELRDAD